MQTHSSSRWHALILGTLSVLVLTGTAAMALRQTTGITSFLGQAGGGASSQASSVAPAAPLPPATPLPGGVTLALRPHCTNPVQQSCPAYTAATPTSLETPSLPLGDVLDMDVMVQNDGGAALKRVKVRLQFDPTILEGIGVIPGDAFPTAAPLPDNFDGQQGTATIDVETAGTQATTGTLVPVAEIQFIVKSVPAGGKSVIAFAGTAGADPQTAVLTGDTPPRNLLSSALGTLTVSVVENVTGSGAGIPLDPVPAAPPAAPPVTSSSAAPAIPPAVPPANPMAASSSQAASGSTIPVPPVPEPTVPPSTTQPIPETPPPVAPPPIETSEIPPVEASSQPALPPAPPSPVETAETLPPVEPTPPPENTSSETPLQTPRSDDTLHPAASTGATSDRTTFVLLQVQNVRVTTEGTSLYVAWDALPSPRLQGYNVYYGTEMGRYIQRRSVRPTDLAVVVRSLVQGTRYYVAVRGFNESGEETAFSKEAAVQIGDPRTSTSPLRASTLPVGQGENPLGTLNGDGTVPGASGAPSTILLFAILSAVIGTLFAFRRQYTAASVPPRP